MKRGRQSTTTPQALRQGNRAVAKATRYPEGGTSTNTGPGHHKGPTTGGGRQQETGKGSQQQPRRGQTQRSPTTPIEAHKSQRKGHPQKRRQKHKHNKKHHKQEPGTRRKETRHPGQTDGKESTAQTMNTQTNDQTTKRGARRGTGPKKAAKRPPPHGSKWGKSLHGDGPTTNWITSSKRERNLCENKAAAILEQMQAGRLALIKKDGEELLIAIVLDRPLAEAKALVEAPDAFIKQSPGSCKTIFPLFLCLVSCLCLAILGCDATMLPSPA